MTNTIKHLNPDGLFKNPAFSQVVLTKGSGNTAFIGGQNAVNEKGEIIGKGDIAIQTEQTMRNIQIALTAFGGTIGYITKLNIYILQGQYLYSAFQASQQFLAGISEPPAITVLFVSGFANPDFLIEIDAIAFIPD